MSFFGFIWKPAGIISSFFWHAGKLGGSGDVDFLLDRSNGCYSTLPHPGADK
jgi:hypothetical protein